MLNQLRSSAEALCHFRVSEFRLESQPSGELRCRVILDDASDRATLLCSDALFPHFLPEVGELWAGILEPRIMDGRLYVRADSVWRMETAEVASHGASLLPRNACPSGARSALDELVQLVGDLSDTSLCAFANHVFADPTISPAFLRCRASANHHHSTPGGLLIHSVAVARRTADLAGRMRPSEREVVMLAGLLHDVGKLATVGPGPGRPLLGRWIHHEAMTLELLAPHLSRLDQACSKSAALLRHSLVWYSRGGFGFARFPGADIVKACDGVDVAMERGGWEGTGSACGRIRAFRSS